LDSKLPPEARWQKDAPTVHIHDPIQGQVKSSQVFNPHNSKSSQCKASEKNVSAYWALWCCSSSFSASGWADIHIISLSFLSLMMAAFSPPTPKIESWSYDSSVARGFGFELV
jgi:hypothetical protein